MSVIETAEKNLDLTNKMVETAFQLSGAINQVPEYGVERAEGTTLDIAVRKVREIRKQLLAMLPELQAYALLAQNECKNDVMSSVDE